MANHPQGAYDGSGCTGPLPVGPWAQVIAHGWEGLVAKDEGAPYVLGARTRRWVKVKHRIRMGWPGEGEEYRRA